MLSARILTLAAATCAAVSAVPIKWYITNLVLSDGGRVTGSFVYDADTLTYSNVKVSSTPGIGVTSATSLTAGEDYAVPSTVLFSPLLPTHFGLAPGGTIVNNQRLLDVLTETPLTNAGGTVAIKGDTSEYVFTNNGNSVQGPVRHSNAGGLLIAAQTGQTWHVTGLTLPDGASVLGSFTFDAVSNTCSHIKLTITGGQDGTVSFGTGLGCTPSTLNAVQSTVVGVGSRVLRLTFGSPLTNAPGTIILNFVFDGQCADAGCSSVNATNSTQLQGSVTTNPPTGYSKVLSQLPDGGSWQTTVVLTNVTDAPAPYVMNFYGESGAPVSLPGIASPQVGTVPPRGIAFLRSTGAAANLTTAWARVDNAQNLSITALLTWKKANIGGDQQGAVYADPLGSKSVLASFDNTAGAVTGLAMVNPDPNNAVTILAIGYDPSGQIILNDASVTLPPLGHRSFTFNSQPGFSALASGQGTLRLFTWSSGSPVAPVGGINAVMIRALPNLAYTNIAVINQ